MNRWGATDDPEVLKQAYSQGLPLVIPTESSYGLGVDPWNVQAVQRVFQLKNRPPGQALPVVVASVEQLTSLGVVQPQPILDWVQGRWPAALSVVVEVQGSLPATAGLDSLAVRIPDHPQLREILNWVGPLTATSANWSGEAPLLTVGDALDWLGDREALVVDGGDLPGGAPSTLVQWDDGVMKVLREGRYSFGK